MRPWLQVVLFVVAVAIIVACLWGQPFVGSVISIGVGAYVGTRLRTRRLEARDRRRADREDQSDLRRSRA